MSDWPSLAYAIAKAAFEIALHNKDRIDFVDKLARKFEQVDRDAYRAGFEAAIEKAADEAQKINDNWHNHAAKVSARQIRHVIRALKPGTK